jgi:hypothetical protein
MKVRALRGVCIGVERHLKPGDVEDLDPALVTFLVGIGAVEKYVDPAPELDLKAQAEPEPQPKAAPARAGKQEK